MVMITNILVVRGCRILMSRQAFLFSRFWNFPRFTSRVTAHSKAPSFCMWFPVRANKVPQQSGPLFPKTWTRGLSRRRCLQRLAGRLKDMLAVRWDYQGVSADSFIVACGDLLQNANPQNWKISVCCFKLLNLWQSFTAAAVNQYSLNQCEPEILKGKKSAMLPNLQNSSTHSDLTFTVLLGEDSNWPHFVRQNTDIPRIMATSGSKGWNVPGLQRMPPQGGHALCAQKALSLLAVEEWIKKMGHVYTTEYYLAIKGAKLFHLHRHR